MGSRRAGAGAKTRGSGGGIARFPHLLQLEILLAAPAVDGKRNRCRILLPVSDFTYK
jgi:hypothetical protein